MNPFVDVALRTFAVVLGATLALVCAFLALSIATSLLTQYTLLYGKRPTPEQRPLILMEAYRTGLAVLSRTSASLTQADWPMMRDWMTAYLKAHRLSDRITTQDVAITKAAYDTTPQGLIEQTQQAMTGYFTRGEEGPA